MLGLEDWINMNDPWIKKTNIEYYEVVDKPSQDELNAYYADKYYQQGIGSYEISYDEEELIFIKQKKNNVSMLQKN